MSSAWAQPGVEQVAPGVHRIPLPMPTDGLRAVNVYALHADDGIVLIDGGCADADSRAALVDGLAAIGAGTTDVRRVLVTHAHRDHYPQAVALRRDVGARVSVGVGERASVAAAADESVSPILAHLAILRAAGAGELADVLEPAARGAVDTSAWAEPDDYLADGATVAVGGRTLRTVATPGHTQGHLVYRDVANGLLFTGDHVLPEITPSIGFEASVGPLPLRDYLVSLRLLRAQPDARLLPAHGPVTDSVHSRVTALLAHHNRRLAAAAALVAGPTAAIEVARGLPWTRRERAFADLDAFNQLLAVTETVAHLDLLVHRAVLRATDGGTVRSYAPA